MQMDSQKNVVQMQTVVLSKLTRKKIQIRKQQDIIISKQMIFIIQKMMLVIESLVPTIYVQNV